MEKVSLDAYIPHNEYNENDFDIGVIQKIITDGKTEEVENPSINNPNIFSNVQTNNEEIKYDEKKDINTMPINALIAEFVLTEDIPIKDLLFEKYNEMTLEQKLDLSETLYYSNYNNDYMYRAWCIGTLGVRHA